MKLNPIEIIENLFEINRRVCFNLWDIANVNSTPQGLSPRLILPKRRSGDIRISEQEARILYCGILNTLNYYYSIETPTQEVYQQTGEQPISGSSDLSCYIESNNKFEKIANIEFKAHNADQMKIRKDIEKLIKEQIPGNWFHTLKNAESNTLPSLFQKFKDSFLQFHDIGDNVELFMVFCFCIIEKKWACLKYFHFEPSETSFQEYVENFFRLDYTIKSGKILVQDQYGWNIIEKELSLYR